MVYQREILVQTSGHKEMHNLTDEVARIVNESKVRQGIAGDVGQAHAAQP